MAIGDVWRCAVSGVVGPSLVAPLGDHSEWVNILHLKTFDGAVSENDEADGAMSALVASYQQVAANSMFGEGMGITKIKTQNLTSGFSKDHPLTILLGTEEVLPLPIQVCVAVTGRSDEKGRRVTLYLAGISEVLLGSWGQLDPGVEFEFLSFLFGTKFGGPFSFDCVMFDRDGVLPTLIIDIFKVSGNWRTQRRRALTAGDSFNTKYEPVSA